MIPLLSEWNLYLALWNAHVLVLSIDSWYIDLSCGRWQQVSGGDASGRVRLCGAARRGHDRRRWAHPVPVSGRRRFVVGGAPRGGRREVQLHAALPALLRRRSSRLARAVRAHQRRLERLLRVGRRGCALLHVHLFLCPFSVLYIIQYRQQQQYESLHNAKTKRWTGSFEPSLEPIAFLSFVICSAPRVCQLKAYF